MQPSIHEQKIQHLFRSFDVDGSGYIDKADLDAMADRVAKEERCAQDAKKCEKLKASFQSFWQSMSTLDKDRDGRVTQKEFVDYFAQLQKDPKANASQVVSSISNILFTCADHNGSGTISSDEFEGLCKAYGITNGDVKKAFSKHARSDPSKLSRTEWDALVKEMFYSTDPNCAGSMLLMGVQPARA
ncbi:EF-hand domain-containing protein [Melittangium boletus]|uniref:EF-hand domain-containing protein n=1 Tax=Melittangium boletus DSM 14713 TaxID=1294270 RepID=A0A250IP55_9BACT|nr:EF-hand domain-containing protein [Melittangium boletus]ATB33514.1 hypothetical protein MEBOL_007012 [Melittangium boletus DSM 14713]